MAPTVAPRLPWLKSFCQQLRYLSIIAFIAQLAACSPSAQIARESKKIILSDSNFRLAHVGISIYDPSTNKHLYRYQAEKYFIPASNTKLYTCYAAMKHLGDSLAGIRYRLENDTTMLLVATGDPTLLHPDFKTQPVIRFLKETRSRLHLALNWKETPLGNGWAWNDYDADYMPERSALPISGNLLTIEGNATQYKYYPSVSGITVISDRTAFTATRAIDSNVFTVPLTDRYQQHKIPFKTNNGQLNIAILEAACGKPVEPVSIPSISGFSVIRSQPLDSLLKLMMHRSDNFFAEQTLLM
ncbi:MAG TPA: D-alanyl-D-alanine carboxypeptidase, partial [Chitinophagaceae bacterium]